MVSVRRAGTVAWVLGSCLSVGLFMGCGGSSATDLTFGDGGDEGAALRDAGRDARASDAREDTTRPEAGADAREHEKDAAPSDSAPPDGAADAGPVDAATDSSPVDARADAGADAGADTGADAEDEASEQGDAGEGGSTCGNGVLDPGEECDDGNLLDLDGCDSSCNYEVVTRMTALALSGSTAPSGCTPNANQIGKRALTATFLDQMNAELQQDVTDGTDNTMFQFLGLSDLTGANATGFTVGLLAGATSDPAKGAWPAAGNPIDWWFLADPTSVSMGLPTNMLPNGSIVARALTAGPGRVRLTLSFFDGFPLDFVATQIFATIGAARNVPAPPPASLAAGLTVFETITGSGNNQGLCGNVTVASLAKIPVPAILAAGGTTPCGACTGSNSYTACSKNATMVGPDCNSMLDVLVGGCGVLDCAVAAVNPTQPDVPGGGAAKVQPLAPDANGKVAVPAGDKDSYSSYWTFDANRAHFTGQMCNSDQDCQDGQTCNAGGTCR